jgi:hypothetical protein
MIGGMSLKTFFTLLIILLISVVLLGSSSVPAGDKTESVRAYTDRVNYIAWTPTPYRTSWDQPGYSSLLACKVAPGDSLEYLDLVSQTQQRRRRWCDVFDLEISDPIHSPSRDKLQSYKRRALLFTGRSILQAALPDRCWRLRWRQPVPPILYRTTPLP